MQALSRFKKNSAYFRINYFVFILLTTVVCMVMNPSSLVVLGLLGALWFYLFIVRQAAITIGGRAFRCLCSNFTACRKSPCQPDARALVRPWPGRSRMRRSCVLCRSPREQLVAMAVVSVVVVFFLTRSVCCRGTPSDVLSIDDADIGEHCNTPSGFLSIDDADIGEHCNTPSGFLSIDDADVGDNN